MNQLLVEHQIKILLSYFEKYPQKQRVFNAGEYKNLVRGVLVLVMNSSDSFDHGELSQILFSKKVKNKSEFRNELQKILKNQKETVVLTYPAIETIIKIMWQLITDSGKTNLSGEDWLQVTSALRDFDLERLSFNAKKK